MRLENVHCQCGKIVAQLKENVIIIKCRHCKRFIVINTKGLEVGSQGKKIEYHLEFSEAGKG